MEAHGVHGGGDGPGTVPAGVDGSPTSFRAAAYGAGLARRQGAWLVAAFVARTPATARLVPDAETSLQSTLAEIGEEVRWELEEGARGAGVRVEFVSLSGDPFRELSRLAEELQADAVVVGTSTHTGHRLVGSLAVRLVRAGRWPVTVVP
ncbi:universal stress protein [Streptomyces sp. NPDC001380]|uniref:universal stress protein n=1 Tax=Streptomyces sp. NPDC001380 TaxID=3364566 RepID=UPI003692D2FE